MPARLFSARVRAIVLAFVIVASLAAAGLTASSARAATSSLCYLWPTTMVGPGGTKVLTSQIMTGGRAPIAGVTALLENWYSGAWHPYDRRVTDSTGKAYIPVKPPITMALRIRFAGTAASAPCASGQMMLWVSSDARVITEAARHAGKPYVYGATGPNSFDCSGYTQYVFRRFGFTLPRTTGQQYASMKHISKSAVLSGDLIFFGASVGGIYHVGIYAGGGYIWASPASGGRVQKQKIWTSAYYVGRL